MIAQLIPQKLIRQRLEILDRVEGRDGPVCVALHAAAGRQGTGFGAGALPRGAQARRFQWPLLLSRTRPAGARCRRQRALGGERGADCRLPARFGRARPVLVVALRHERDAQDRSRGPRDAHRDAQGACRHHRRGDVRWPWSQISDLGAQPFRAELAEATEKVRAFRQEPLGAKAGAQE
jgi:hypothetical protein